MRHFLQLQRENENVDGSSMISERRGMLGVCASVAQMLEPTKASDGLFASDRSVREGYRVCGSNVGLRFSCEQFFLESLKLMFVNEFIVQQFGQFFYFGRHGINGCRGFAISNVSLEMFHVIGFE